METVCSNCKNSLISQLESNKVIQYYKTRDTCRPIKTHIHVDCVNYEKFNKLITDLHQSRETNKTVLEVVEGERSSITYLIQTMNADLVKFECD